MTRREEIEQAAMQVGGVHPDWDALECFRVGYKEGANWADKTMIEKACEWITEHIDIPYEGEFIDDSPVASDYVEYLSKRLEYAKAVADAFKQAMEE